MKWGERVWVEFQGVCDDISGVFCDGSRSRSCGRRHGAGVGGGGGLTCDGGDRDG